MKLPEYTITKINERFYRIKNYSVNLHLIIGDDKVVLVDTGFGQSSILDFIQTHIDITNKELIVVNTHTHVDHCRGNFAFDEIYLYPDNILKDGSLIGYHSYAHIDPRADFKRRFNIEIEAPFPVRTYDHITYRSLVEGDYFDLGNVTLRVIETPGHTLADIGLYWEEEQIFIAGDTFDTLIWAYFDNAAKRSQYLATIDKVLQLQAKAIYTGHGFKPRDNAFLVAMSKVLGSITYENTTPTPPNSLPRPNVQARDYVMEQEVHGKTLTFKVQFHATNFLD